MKNKILSRRKIKTNYVTGIDYNALGAPVKYSFACDFSFGTSYNLLKRVESLYTVGMKNSAGLVSDQRLTYSYDGVDYSMGCRVPY